MDGQGEQANMDENERDQRASEGRLLRGSAGYAAGQVATTPDGAATATGTTSTSTATTTPAPITNPTTKPNLDTNTKDKTNANANANTGANTGANAGVNPNTGAKTDVGAKTSAKTDSYANPNTKSDVDVTPRATQLCQQVLSAIATTCAKYVRDTDHHIHTRCIADTALMRDLAVVDHAKLGYLRECRRELDARLSSQTACATETKALQKDRDAPFFGDLSRCAKQCSGRGKCLAAGCQCDAGYTGLGCDVKI